MYNALNSIAILCMNEPEKAEHLTLQLAQYMRSSFDYKQLDAMTTLGGEMELVEAYVHVEKARFGTRLHVVYELDADRKIRIPPLILQPLVENAIRHGLMSNWRGGTVRISVTPGADGRVSFVIEDDGCGMSPQKREDVLNPDVEKKGVGLWNISQRLKALYGSDIQIESEEGKGTRFAFTIPARAQAEHVDLPDRE
ncbi:ATP-binding protein [Paenibacillus sp. GYB004]|uniref:sensor histidine kinase n=1 Tax=Paenibacillus sp. GYB004 TaxID=2994393 RepID=UPI002F96BE86